VHIHFIVPGDIATLTGGYIYDRRIIEGLPEQGICVNLHLLDQGFPFPSPRALDHAAAIIQNIPEGETLVVDGLALGPLHAILKLNAGRLHLVALIHHPLAEETGLKQDVARQLKSQERKALFYCQRVIVTSSTTRLSLVKAYDVGENSIVVVEPGVELVRQVRNPVGREFRLLCVASLVPRKGHKTLIEALSLLSDRSWTLTCVGDLNREPGSTVEVLNYVRKVGLGQRIKFLGTLGPAALLEHYRRAHVFVLASHHEGYGMALAEALSQGLPIVSTTAGAIVHTVPKSAGLLVPPGDVSALAAALARVFDEPRCRQRLIAGARGSRWKRRGWATVVCSFASELRQMINDG
jgi:glycosyltransferase involved in cell wall biosynthesis